MPFVKLDCDILDSSLWLFDPERILFLTALCMAVPREFDEPIAQISVRNLCPTGFVAPPGWYGFLRASPMSLIERAKVGGNSDALEQAFEALEQLGNDDIDSRSHAFEGRRLIRVDGGFVVLRFMEFRDHDYKNAERQRRWRERERERKSNVVTGVTSNGYNTPERVTVTQADAEDRRQKHTSKSKNGAKAPTHKHSKPDSFEELKAYVVDKLNLEENDAAALWEHWKGNGFKNAGRPIVDWRMVASNWERRGFFFPSIQQPRFQK
jgi:hypothetical protein